MSAPAAAEPALRVTCWGTRGSIPAPGPATVRFGGNTSCVEVRAAGCRLIFDAGTGIRELSGCLATEGRPLDAHLFVTHYHWDHIQGFPFLAQLYEPATRLRVHGPMQGDVPVDQALEGQMSPLYFPVPLEAIAASVEFATADGSPWRGDGVCVDAYRANHPGVTYGYRVAAAGATAVYIPDNELDDDPDPAWYRGLVEFVRGADLLLHDAMLTDAEYELRRGWGHSTFAQAVRLAEEGGVRRLRLFHHAPDRSDGELAAIAAELRAGLVGRGSALEVEVAAEREEIVIAAGGA
ncbi:MAG TPA: MBL fold metallo-hydrolase [Longimicrobium sp.]|jgi:phosphoribosyl 1,2-cyclic phosphodiesterase|nr:MBL fold metallo-hydrolase [Longimicrobium sp.]